MTDEERCREAFEKWIDVSIERGEEGEYDEMWIEDSWKSWQACWKLCGGVK